jgi:hypothetical protein
LKTDYTGMIPPVSVREIRSCESCHACNQDCDYGCNCGLDELFVTRNDSDSHWHDSSSHVNITLNIPILPCKYHLTDDEYIELIDSGVVE